MDAVNKGNAIQQCANAIDSSILEISTNNPDDTLGYQTADESSSKYFSVIADSTLEGTSSADVTLENKSDINDSLTAKEQFLNDFSNIQSKSVDKLQIHEKIDAAKILSGGVDIFDDNENSSDEHGLVIDYDAQAAENADNNPLAEEKAKIEADVSSECDKPPVVDSKQASTTEELKKNEDEKLLIKEKEDELAVEQDVERTDNYSALLQSNLPEGSSEVTLLINDKNVDAIDIGEGVFIYKNEEGELTAIQITVNEDGTNNIKCLLVGKNEDGNLEVYEEQVNQVPVTNEELESMRSQELAAASSAQALTTTDAIISDENTGKTDIVNESIKELESNVENKERVKEPIIQDLPKLNLAEVTNESTNKNLEESKHNKQGEIPVKDVSIQLITSDADEQGIEVLKESSKVEEIVENDSTTNIMVSQNTNEPEAESNCEKTKENVLPISSSGNNEMNELSVISISNESNMLVTDEIKVNLQIDDPIITHDASIEMNKKSFEDSVNVPESLKDEAILEKAIDEDIKKPKSPAGVDIDNCDSKLTIIEQSLVSSETQKLEKSNVESSDSTLSNICGRDDSANIVSTINVTGVSTKISDPVLPCEIVSDSQDSASNILSTINNEESSNTIESVVSSCPSINPSDSIISEQLLINDALSPKLCENNKLLTFEMSNLKFKSGSTQSASTLGDASQGETLSKSSDEDLSNDSNMQPLVIEDDSVSQDSLVIQKDDAVSDITQKSCVNFDKFENDTCVDTAPDKAVSNICVKTVDESTESQNSMESDDDDYVVGEPVTGDSGAEWNNTAADKTPDVNTSLRPIATVGNAESKCDEQDIAKPNEEIKNSDTILSDNNNISKNDSPEKESVDKNKEVVIKEVDFDKFVRRTSVQMFEECVEVEYEDVTETVRTKSIPILELEFKTDVLESHTKNLSSVEPKIVESAKVYQASPSVSKSHKSANESASHFSSAIVKTPSPVKSVNAYKPSYSPVGNNEFITKSSYSPYSNQFPKHYVPNNALPSPLSPSQSLRQLDTKPKTYSPVHKSVFQNSPSPTQKLLSPQKPDKYLNYTILNEKRSPQHMQSPPQRNYPSSSVKPVDISPKSVESPISDKSIEENPVISQTESDISEAQKQKNRQPRKQVFTPVTSSDMEIIFPNLFSNAQEYKKEADAKTLKLKKEQDLKFKQLSRKEQSKRAEKAKVPNKPSENIVSPVRNVNAIPSRDSPYLSSPVKSFDKAAVKPPMPSDPKASIDLRAKDQPNLSIPVKSFDKTAVKSPMDPIVKTSSELRVKDSPNLSIPVKSFEKMLKDPVQSLSPTKTYSDPLLKDAFHLSSPVKSFDQLNSLVETHKAANPVRGSEKIKEFSIHRTSPIKGPDGMFIRDSNYSASSIKHVTRDLSPVKSVEKRPYLIDLPSSNVEKGVTCTNTIPNHHAIDNSKLKDHTAYPRTYSRTPNKSIQNTYNQNVELSRPKPNENNSKPTNLSETIKPSPVQKAIEIPSKQLKTNEGSHSNLILHAEQTPIISKSPPEKDSKVIQSKIHISSSSIDANKISMDIMKMNSCSTDQNQKQVNRDLEPKDKQIDKIESLSKKIEVSNKPEIKKISPKTPNDKSSMDKNSSPIQPESDSKRPENQSPVTDSAKRKRGRPKKVFTDAPSTPKSGDVESPKKEENTAKKKLTPKESLQVEEKSRASSISPFGKIDDNIKCPICFKTFRTHNVLLKHVKHCNGTADIEIHKTPKKRKLTDSLKSESMKESDDENQKDKNNSSVGTDNDKPPDNSSSPKKSKIDMSAENSSILKKSRIDSMQPRSKTVDNKEPQTDNISTNTVNVKDKPVTLLKNHTVETVALEDSIIELDSVNVSLKTEEKEKDESNSSDNAAKNNDSLKMEKTSVGRPPKDKNSDDSKQNSSKQTAASSPASKADKNTDIKAPDNTTISCTVCGKTFRQLAHMAYHRSSKHNIVENDERVDESTPVKSKPDPVEATTEIDAMLKCETCHKGFRKLHHLVEHRETHISTETKSRRTSVASVKSEPEAGFRCDTCDKSFRKLHHLVEHRELHLAEVSEPSEIASVPKGTDAKPAEDATCPSCGKSFRKRHHMVEHRDVHCSPSKKGKGEDGSTVTDNDIRLSVASSNSDEGNSCGICGKSYRKLHHMVEHRESHAAEEKSKSKSSEPEHLSTKDIIHECSRCYMVFPNENSLNKHIDICSRKRIIKKSFSFNPQDSDETANVSEDLSTKVPPENNGASLDAGLKSSNVGDDDDVVVLDDPVEPPKKIVEEEPSAKTSPSPEKHVLNSATEITNKKNPPLIKSMPSKEPVKSQKPDRKSLTNKEKSNAKPQTARTSTLTKDTISSKSRKSTKITKAVVDNVSVSSRASSVRKSSISSGSVSSRISSKRKLSSSIECLPSKRANTKDGSNTKVVNPRGSLDTCPNKITKVPQKKTLQTVDKDIDEDLSVKYKFNEISESDIKYKINPEFSKSIKRLSQASGDVKHVKTVPMKAKTRKSESALSGLKIPKVLQTIIEESNVRYSFPKSPKVKSAEPEESTSSQVTVKKVDTIKQTTGKKVVITKKTNIVIANKRKSLGGRKSLDTKKLPGVAKKLELRCCSQIFISQADLATHRKTHKANVKVHKCDCGKVFDTEGLLKRHIDVEHTPPKSYKCTVCGTSVRTAAQFAKHKRDHEIEQKTQKPPAGKKARGVKAPVESKQVKSEKNAQSSEVSKTVKASSDKNKSPVKETRKGVKRKVAHGGVPLSEKMKKAMAGAKF